MLPTDRGGFRRGLTLPEVLVAGSLLLLLSALFAGLASQARSSSEGGLEQLEMRSQHRQVQRRLTLLLKEAIAPNEVDPAIVHPELDEASPSLEFHAPADLLEPERSFDPRRPVYLLYRISLDPETTGLRVEEVAVGGATQNLGRGFTEVEFRRPSKRGVEARLVSERGVRGASGGRKQLTVETRSLIRLLGVR